MFYNIVFKHVHANIPYYFVSGCIWVFVCFEGILLFRFCCWFVWLLFDWYSCLYYVVFCTFYIVIYVLIILVNILAIPLVFKILSVYL